MGIATLGRKAAFRQKKVLSKGKTVTPGERLDTSNRDNRFEQLTEYIPTETITLFIAAVSVRKVLIADLSLNNFWANPWTIILCFAILTPAMLVLSAYASFKEYVRDEVIGAETKFKLPWFEMLAATIAFFIWSLAVPGIFEAVSASVQAIAAFAALLASWCFSKLSKIFRQ